MKLLEALKRVHVAVGGLESVDLHQMQSKYQGFTFHIIKKFRTKKLLQTSSDIQNILNIWRKRSLTIEGKITIFKILALSKVVYLALLTIVPNHIIEELIKISQNSIQTSSGRRLLRKASMILRY